MASASHFPRQTAASKLRTMLQDQSKIIVAPGVYDGISARIALSLGYEALYMTGAGTSLSRLGWADLGLTTATEMTTQADTLANLSPSTPLIADADTGYGGPIAVARTVSAYARAGVAALHLEDQVQEKRCGHLGGKQVVARETFWARIRAAANAREELGSEILIVARTDARQGLGFEEAVTRLRGAVEVGADVVFPEAMASREEAAEMVRRMGETPCLLNLVEGGVTPEVTVEEAREMGFRIVIFPVTAFEGAIVGIRDVLRKLKREGKMPATGVGVKDAFDLCGLQECVELDKKAGGKAYSNV